MTPGDEDLCGKMEPGPAEREEELELSAWALAVLVELEGEQIARRREKRVAD